MQMIKNTLKRMNVTQSEFANAIGVSRPTLDAYIDQFQKTGHIIKDEYNQIFINLFASAEISYQEFHEKLQMVVCDKKRENNINTCALDDNAEEYIYRVQKAMISDMLEGDWDEKIYYYILLTISNYKNDEIFREYARYVADLNTEWHEEITSTDKQYYSFFHKNLGSLFSRKPEFDQKEFDDFLKQKEILRKQKEERKETVRQETNKELMDKIKEIQKKYEDMGKEASKNEIIDCIVGRGMYQ
ncbi:hypothetical protein SAMN04487831_106128 [Pseudobutyrivibrio sp. UC1225]|uniref:hypothetical protein n=1 Tax=Pseudobutyrivibrio sp. UC1225 TaxID=1798185 RepID=UPI0008E4FF81|nr:hypothetical protein [Pseudobutyrivibrio sp. UC1225]SFO03623.1 hypothetical protein SAMN04487831_106128 [Pseudobutyrivibrio sp. UC1225]